MAITIDDQMETRPLLEDGMEDNLSWDEIAEGTEGIRRSPVPIASSSRIETLGRVLAIDTQMVPSKLVYFFFSASSGCILPFIPVFLESTGLTVRETGLIMGLAFVAGTLFPVFFGWIADSTKSKRLLFSLIIVGYTASLFSLPFVAHFLKFNSSEVTLKRDNANSVNVINISDGANSRLFSTSYHNVESRSTPEFKSSLFFGLLVITVLGHGFQLSFLGIMDSIVSNVIQNTGTYEHFGKQAMFSELGYAAGDVISNAISDSFPNLTISSYMGNFYTFLPFVLPVLPVLILTYRRTTWNEASTTANVTVVVVPDEASSVVPSSSSTTPLVHVTEEAGTGAVSKMRHLLNVIRHPENVVVMATMILLGLLRTVASSFIYIFMKEEMGASNLEIGLADGAVSLSGFLIFPFSDVLIRTFRGPKTCMGIAVATYIFVLVAISLVRTPWIAILLQLIPGAGDGIFKPSVVKHTTDVTPKEIYNTMFLLNICLSFGIPGVVGNFTGGLLYYQFKGPAMFQGTAALGGIWLLFMGVFFLMRRLMIINCSKSKEASE